MSNTRRPGISRDDERLREAVRWYVRLESDTELSPAEWQDWENWSSDPDRCAQYDEIVRLHRQAKTLPRPALPNDEEIRGDVSRTDALRGSVFWSARRGYSGHRSLRSVAAAATAGVILVAVLAGALVTLGTPFKKRPTEVAAPVKQADAAPFSEATLENLRASGRPVLVNLRAGWCGTCVVNERIALSRESVRRMMKRKRVAYLKGELTNANSAVSATLQQFGRQGVPLYLLYCPGMSEPEILPERLTEDIVLSALSRLPDRS